MKSRSLKSQNMKWLLMLATADLVLVLVLLSPVFPTGANIAELGNWKLITTALSPIIVLLIVNALPHSVKSALVYWKSPGWLPGTEVFTKHAPNDPRISMQALINNVGELPTEPKEQNTKWYALYKLVENEPEIEEAQKSFLLYRDMAVLSLPFIVVAPASLHFAGATTATLWLTAGVFTLQYLLAAISARWSGIRFVTNVLAVHSVSGRRPGLGGANG